VSIYPNVAGAPKHQGAVDLMHGRAVIDVLKHGPAFCVQGSSRTVPGPPDSGG